MRCGNHFGQWSCATTHKGRIYGSKRSDQKYLQKGLASGGLPRKQLLPYGTGHHQPSTLRQHDLRPSPEANALALHTGPGQRERTRAGSATSRRTPSQVAGLRAGPRSMHIWIVRSVRSPISATTARLVNLQVSASLASPMPFGRCQAVHRLDSCAKCRRTAPSIPTRTAIP